jgi:hypothetical protein
MNLWDTRNTRDHDIPTFFGLMTGYHFSLRLTHVLCIASDMFLDLVAPLLLCLPNTTRDSML